MQVAPHTSAVFDRGAEANGSDASGDHIVVPLENSPFVIAAAAHHSTTTLQTPSALALYLASLHDLPSTEARADASLAGVVDSSLEFMHKRSQRQRPPVRFVLAGLPDADRHDSLAWMLRAFEVMNFSDATLFHAVLLLDRYYALQPYEEVGGVCASSQQRLLAAVAIALKTGPQEDLQLSVRQIILHLSRNSIDFSEVVIVEVAMLQTLQFCIGTPTTHDFCEALNTRCLNCDHRCKSLSDYLLQITLVDVHLHYKYSHAILAAAVLALALFAMRAPAEAFTCMLEDLAVIFVQSTLPKDELLNCCAEVHELWAESSCKGESAAEGYLWHLRAKFAREDRHGVSSMSPPDMPPLSFPPQYDIQDALNAIHQGMLACASSETGILSKHIASDAQNLKLASWMCGSRNSDIARHPVNAQHSFSGAGLGEESWFDRLEFTLRRLADRSRKLHYILAQHGWQTDEFSRPPDLERLFADVARVARDPAMDPHGAAGKEAKELSCIAIDTQYLGDYAEEIHHGLSSGSLWRPGRFSPAIGLVGLEARLSGLSLASE
mmetsp:Transcript_75617/g.196771  ORF Transcript_75617/g.196771 Transcript_75617/m.196771 type:complete len:551 (+) Transcript_75617:107-1759(+)